MAKAKIFIIAAVAKNGTIGRNGKIPWDLKEDKKWFRKKTIHHAIIMGRKTFESMGTALPKRLNIVISSAKNYSDKNLISAHNFEEAVKIAGAKKIFVIGGEKIYKEALPFAKKIYLTEINREFEGDTFFPEFNKSLYTRKVIKSVKADPSFEFVEYNAIVCRELPDLPDLS